MQLPIGIARFKNDGVGDCAAQNYQNGNEDERKDDSVAAIVTCQSGQGKLDRRSNPFAELKFVSDNMMSHPPIVFENTIL